MPPIYKRWLCGCATERGTERGERDDQGRLLLVLLWLAGTGVPAKVGG